MTRSSKTAHHLALFVGLTVVACAQPPVDPLRASEAAIADAEAEDSAWIEGTVALDEGRPVRVLALPKERGRGMFSADPDAEGHYRLGPLPPGDYEVVVMSPFGEESQVDSFPTAAVSAIAGESVRSDFVQPGVGTLLVRFPVARAPGTLVTSVILLDGSLGRLSISRVRELRRDMDAPARNTISDDDPTTTFRGLAPGPYTACAIVNLGGDNLHATCGIADVAGAAPAELSLDVQFG